MNPKNIVSLTSEINPGANDYLITIVIPTYNRLDNLIDLLFFIDKYAGKRTCAYVLDNGSNYLYDAAVLKNNIKNINIKFFANKYHLGPDASVLRALEIANTPWIYLLGDSKIPRADYLKCLEDDCLAHPNAMGIIYRFRNVGEANININNIDELQKNVSDLGDLFLGGNSLISKKAICKYFSIASMYTLTRMPHSLFHIMALKNGETVYISNSKLIDKFVSKPTHYDPGLSLIECWAQFALTLTLPLNTKELKTINKMILDMENRASIINFYKFSLLQIFRHKKDIRPHLLRVLKYRYIFSVFCWERFFTLLIYMVAVIWTPFFSNDV